MSAADDSIDEILQELKEAKSWPSQLKHMVDEGSDMGNEIRKADERIEALEKRAKEAIRRMGCVDPQTRMISQGMADMLITWYAFKDSLAL
jgi:hypothetical protein